MVGTAYLSAEPGAAPFVAIGQQVKEGETLMIVEAMKTMNHPSPRAGTGQTDSWSMTAIRSSSARP